MVHRGELVGERYEEGFGRFTPQRSWSSAKSLTGTLAGLLVDAATVGAVSQAPDRRQTPATADSGGSATARSDSAAAFFASGAFGQNALVIPSHDLVIARMGTLFPDGDPEGFNAFAATVVEAVERGHG